MSTRRATRIATRLGAGLALTGALVVGTGAGAFAFDCYNASRSEKGSEKAGTQSKAWFTLRIPDVIAEDVENGLYSEEDGACVLAAYADTGAPLAITIHVTAGSGVIGERNPNPERMTDGRGLDHYFESYAGVILGAYEACGVEPPF
jgi:hypothetical protein